MRFEWDEKKARKNLNKHNVSFDEAKTVFADPLFLIFADDEHSSVETRYVITRNVCRGAIVNCIVCTAKRVDTYNRGERSNS